VSTVVLRNIVMTSDEPSNVVNMPISFYCDVTDVIDLCFC